MIGTSTFAARLAALRESQGLSQYELARRTGLTRQTLSRLEMGDREPGWGTVQLLALALGVDCRALADPALTLPGAAEARPKGRPRKAAPAPSDAARPARGKRAQPKGKGK
jgi:transcriptional regulator with XRE-family HTH domain